MKSTIEYVKYLVTQTGNQQTLKGRTVSIDRLYTSIEQAEWLLERDITTVGTVQKGRIGFPSELFDNKGRENFSTTCHFEADKKNMCVTTYTVQTKSKGKKNVVVLSTSRPRGGFRLSQVSHLTKVSEKKVGQKESHCFTGHSQLSVKS